MTWLVNNRGGKEWGLREGREVMGLTCDLSITVAAADGKMVDKNR
jgi:hypothetical protein